MPTCPNGHQSGSEDWCEVCGHRMAGAGAVPPPPPPPPAPGYGYPQGPGEPTAQAELCPQCRTPREAMAPYCEECRWNFLTNTATSYTPLAPQGGPGGPVPGLNLPPGFQAQQGPPPQQQRDPYEYQSSRPSQMNRSAEPLSSEQGGRPGPPPSFQQGPPPPPSFQQQSQQPQSPSPFERQEQQGRPPFEQQHQQGSPPPPFQQQAPSPFEPQQQQQQQAPSPFEQRSAPPQPQAPQTGGDDWLLPPPSQAQPPQPSQPSQPSQQQPPQGYQQGPQSPQQFPGQGQNQGLSPAQNHGQAQHQGQGQGQGGQNQPPRGWTAVIAPDRDYFLAMMQRSGPDATGLNLPAYSPEQHLPLTGSQITIGRRRHSTGESPDIDLSVPPEDPGVSHQHAVLVQQPDGSWAVVDQNSTNGTTLNGAEDPIQPYVPVPLQDGDQVHVGAWTTITVRCD